MSALESLDPDSSPGPADGGRWGRIPAWWLTHPAVDADGLAVLAALSTYANAKGECWPSQATLATALKRSRSTVNRILGHLADAGVIAVEPRHSASGGRLSCLYRLRLVPGDGPIVAPAPDRTPSNRTATAQPRDKDVAEPDSRCASARQEQPGFEQTPYPLTARAPATAHDVPDDWTPNATDLAWAGERFAGIDLQRHVEGFLLRCQAHGYRYRDVGAAWRAWLAQDAAMGKAPRLAGAAANRAGKMTAGPPAQHAAGRAAEQSLGAWMAAAARLNAAVPHPGH